MDEYRRKARYCSYLLRCWETAQQSDEPTNRWRFSLEDPHSGDRRYFASMEMLVAALEADLLESGEEDSHPPDRTV